MLPAGAAEIYINRTGTVQIDITDLTKGGMNNLRNDPVPDFNSYVSRWDIENPIEWTHTWSLATPSFGAYALDADEVYVNMITAELFPVIWDIDYPVNDELDPLFWDFKPYAGPPGAAFDMALNGSAVDLGYVEGNNSLWGAKRITLDTALLNPAGDIEYFWLQVDEDPDGFNWLSSIDYSDLAIVFNWGDLSINKSITGVSGFDPPRVGYTTAYTVRIDIANNTLTSSGGPMHDVTVTDTFPTGSAISTPPLLGSAAMDATGHLTWTVGKLEDGALNSPPAPESTSFMEVTVTVTPAPAQAGAPVVLNAGAAINGKQVPQDPGDGTGNLYPFNFYSNPANDTSAVSAPVLTASVDAANTGNLVTTATIIPGEGILVTVTDPDLNADIAAVETVLITLINQLTGESETIVCAETAPNTGSFTATLATAFGMAPGLDNSGSMNVKAGGTVRATYNDLVNAAGVPAAATADTAVNGGDTGTISSDSPVIPGDNVTITITDGDLNTNAAVAETFQLATVNSRTGESELLTYVETGPDTDVFTAVLVTVFGAAAGANNNGVMNCISGDSLRTVYADVLTSVGGSGTTDASTTVTGGSDGTLDLTAGIFPGNDISITLVDADLNTSPASAQSFSLTLTHSRTGETESVILSVTGVNTGLFAGTVQTIFGAAAGASNDGRFTVRAGDVVSARYDDALTGPGGSASISDSTTVNGGADGSVSSTPRLLPGASAAFTVSDADLNTNPAAVEIYVFQVKNPSTGETENVQFSETGNSSGIFAGTAATVFGMAGGPDNDGSFTVRAGWTLVFSYSDALTAAGGTAARTAVSSITGGATAVLSSTSAAAAGAPVICTLTDPDLNVNSAAADSVSVSAVNDITGETESFVLVETGVNTGVFSKNINTVYNTGTGPDNDGAFFVLGGHRITFSYTDPLNALGGPQALSAVSTLTDDSNSITITGPAGSHNNSVLNVTGSTDPYSTVAMADPATGVSLSVAADAAGNYTFPNIRFPEGTTTFSVTSTDLAGNRASAASTVLVDTSNFIIVNIPIPGSVINAATGDVSGKTDPGATVTLAPPAGGPPLTVTAGPDGVFVFENIRFSIGPNVLNMTSVDVLGNSATTSPSVTVDLSIVLNINTIANGATYNTSIRQVGGVTDPGATVSTTHPTTGATLTTTATPAGTYSFGGLPFPDGPNTVTVRAVDPAGNTASAFVSFFVDTVNTNSISNSGTYRSSAVDISGTTDPLSTVIMIHPVNGQSWRATADATGNYIFPAVPFPDGTYTVTTTSTDPNGNIAAASAGFKVDANIYLVVSDPPNNSVVTNNVVDLSGRTDPGASVSVYSPAADVEISATADGTGAFTLPGVMLNDGRNQMTVSSTDPAGNSLSVSHVIFYFQTIGVSITSPRDGSIVSGNIQDVTGKADPLVTVYMFHPVTGAQLDTTANASGTYSFPGLPFRNGPNTVTVYATTEDASHNILNAETSSSFIVADTGVDASLRASERTVMGQAVYIRVSDGETYLSPSARDTANVTVFNPATGDSETLSLLETAPDSGVFSGYMPTVERQGSDTTTR